MKKYQITILVVYGLVIVLDLVLGKYSDAFDLLFFGLLLYFLFMKDNECEEAKKDIASLAELVDLYEEKADILTEDCEGYRNAYHDICRAKQELEDQHMEIVVEYNKLLGIYYDDITEIKMKEGE